MQPKKVKVDGKIHRCPACNAQTLRWVRQDLYLSFFFLPIFPFKTGQPYLECETCGQVFHAEEMPQAQALAALRPIEPGQPAPQPLPAVEPVSGARPAASLNANPEPDASPSPCRFCGGELAPGYKYCPFCGARI